MKKIICIMILLIVFSSYGLANDEQKLISFNDDGGWGYKNQNDIVVVQPELDMAHDFSEGLALVKKDNVFGYIDLEGNITYDDRFMRASDFHNGKAIVYLHEEAMEEKAAQNQVVYIDKELNIIGPVLEKIETIESPYQIGEELTVMVSMGLNIRKRPDINSETIGAIPYGQQVTIVGYGQSPVPFESWGFTGHWAKIKSNDKTGYVFDGFLSILPPPDDINYIRGYFNKKHKKVKPKIRLWTYNRDSEVVDIHRFETGALLIKWGMLETDNILSSYYIPGATKKDGFLLARLLYQDSRLTSLNDKTLEEGTSITDVYYPNVDGAINFYVSDFESGTDVSLTEVDGYLDITYSVDF